MMDEFLDTGTTAVLMHAVMNDLGIIGGAALTLAERSDVLPSAAREQLLGMIHEAVARSIDTVRFIVMAPSAIPETLMRCVSGVPVTRETLISA